MPQYIQKPGEEQKFTLEEKGFADLQTAADVGFSPVKAPTETSITPDSFNQVDAVDLPDITPPPDTSDELVAGGVQAGEAFEDYMPKETETQKQLVGEQKDLRTQMTDIMAELGEAPKEQLLKEQEAGIPALRKQFASLKGRIDVRSKEFDVLEAKIEAKPISLSSIIGQQAQTRRVKAAEIGLLQSRAMMLQGEITEAQSIVDRSIDLKYSVIENNIGIYEKQLLSIAGDLSREDAKVFTAQQAMLADLKESTAEKKEEEKTIQNVVLTAMENGADERLADMIGAAKTQVEATQIAGELAFGGGWEYVKTPAERDDLIKQGYEITQAGGRTYARLPEITEDLTSSMKEYKLAKQEGFTGSYTDYINFIKQSRTAAPSSFREWKLAGSQEGTGKTYAEFLASGGDGDEEDSIQAFREEASELIIKLDNKDIEWAAAVDSLKSQFPQATYETINAQLGGGIPYNPATSEFDTKGAWGRAK